MYKGLALYLALFGVVATAKYCPGQVPDTAFVKAQWEYVLACTGVTPQPGGKLEDVTWVIVPHGSMNTHTLTISGTWDNADGHTIRLDEWSTGSAWVVRHELLHHLLRGPPSDQGGPHPWAPFAFPCNVMPFQHMAEP